MRERQISVLVAVLVLCLVVLFSCELIKNNVTENSRDKIETQVSEYRVEKRELEQKLSSLQSSHIKETVGASRLMLFFSPIDSLFVDEIYPILKENGVIASICLEKDNLPGVYSAMSGDLYNTLIEDGWQTALYFDGKTTVDKWYSDNEKALNTAGIDFPSVLIIDEGNFNDVIALEFHSLGFDDIIIKAKKPDVAKADIEGGPNLTDSVGWYTNVASGIIDLFASKNGDIAFIIGGDHPEESYEPDQFSTMLNVISKSIENEQLFFTTPRGMAEYKNKLAEAYNLTIDDFNEEKSRLENRINELETLIQEEYDEYLGDK